ncbi:6-phosphofructokinase [Caminibacter pacificus]|uniref:6-phosphofructokinase n=1 Tax=Caminibacter pacificus TaxID=1424653 RepID=A0AAJ4RE04_9BACT|nr:6-phosphofructokinase [Caminibacter pacificus]QCI28258.1 ATP-dependent 6-phosphofructokinase [Caminibacter pacificus]ROR41027.1 6-phosphofructokinase 1 [Caminibacter pacificus]
MNIAILTSGGDSSGMNPAIKKFVECCYEKNYTPYFIYDGLEGMIDGKIKKASYKDVAGIIYRGGTIIRSSRSKRWYEKKYRKIAYENLKNNKIDALIILGGDGSFRALDVFYDEFKIPFMGIPATIDNDIPLNEYTIGVDTALNVIREAVDDIRDTASSFSRAFVIETMGRECGYLALTSAVANGAEMCLIPEVKYNLDNLKKRYLDEIKNGRSYFLAIVAEGLNISYKIKEWFEKEIGFESRVTILGHIQRGGSPTVIERLRTAEFVKTALDNIEKNPDKIVTYYDDKFVLRDLKDIVNSKYELDENMLALAKKLMGI